MQVTTSIMFVTSILFLVTFILLEGSHSLVRASPDTLPSRSFNILHAFIMLQYASQIMAPQDSLWINLCYCCLLESIAQYHLLLDDAKIITYIHMACAASNTLSIWQIFETFTIYYQYHRLLTFKPNVSRILIWNNISYMQHPAVTVSASVWIRAPADCKSKNGITIPFLCRLQQYSSIWCLYQYQIHPNPLHGINMFLWCIDTCLDKSWTEFEISGWLQRIRCNGFPIPLSYKGN